MSSRQAREYQHSEQNWSSYRTFENQQKDYGLRQGGFTTDDRITGFNDITYEPSPEPVKPKPKPKKVNPNLFGFHPRISKRDEQNQQFIKQEQQQMAGLTNDTDDKASLLSDNSSVNRVTKHFGNTRHHPKYFKSRGSSINGDIRDIDEIPLKYKIIGIICIIIAIASWVSLGHVLQRFQSEYDKPYFVSYCITGGLSILFIPWIIYHCYDKYNSRQQFTEKAFKNDTTYTKQELLAMQTLQKGLWKKLIIPSFIFCVLYICCNYFWVTSLEKTMVSVNATIYQSNVALIYILSIFLLDNKLTWQKNIGVVFCGIGVVTVLFGAYKQEDEQENGDIKNEPKGILEAILSVVCYSFNAVLFKLTANKYFKDETKQVKNTLLLQSMTGLIGLLILWPIMFILDSVDVEKFELPQNADDTSLVIASMALNLSFFAAFAISVVLTNPVFTSIGTLFVIPVGYFSDIIIYSYNVELPAILGTIAIGFGFLLLNVPIFSVIKSKLKKKESY